ncbi:hypothetical protein ACFWPV_08185 [Streptomyces uncialis]|uniref:hypothetical protein n=1 Tax=Streptomyces uncialis TaxID=1048205 RepID=UPI003654FB63
MPTWITSRRLGATAVLYAVFVGGWYLGQPLPHVGCADSDPAARSEPPAVIEEPGDFSGSLARVTGKIHDIATVQAVSTSTLVPCDAMTPRPRLVAWVTGDWR